MGRSALGRNHGVRSLERRASGEGVHPKRRGGGVSSEKRSSQPSVAAGDEDGGERSLRPHVVWDDALRLRRRGRRRRSKGEDDDDDETATEKQDTKEGHGKKERATPC